MPILDSIKDPATGKIKPVVLIAGGGIVIVGFFLITNKGSSATTGVTSGGQSGDNTQALADLQSAIQGLAGGNLPEAPGSGNNGAAGDSNVPSDNGQPPLSNPTDYTSATYQPDNTYPYAGGSLPDVPIVASPTPSVGGGTASVTKSDALAAIKARAIAAGFSGSSASVAKTYNADIAKGYTLTQIAKPAAAKITAPSTTATPTAADLAAVRQRAVAAGHNPTDAQVMATYLKYH